MNYGNIKYFDIADGEGVRTTLFVSGCTHHCKGCFQPETWDFDYGEPFTNEVAERIFESVDSPFIAGLTVLGGEPMEPGNQRALVGFLEEVRRRCPDKTIWMYTGFVWETISELEIMKYLDVLVDGEFIVEQKDTQLYWRGSANQRVIDVPSSLQKGCIVLHCE